MASNHPRGVRASLQWRSCLLRIAQCRPSSRVQADSFYPPSTRVRARARARARVCAHMPRMHAHATHARTHARTCTRAHELTHARTHVHTNSCMYVHTHTRMRGYRDAQLSLDAVCKADRWDSCFMARREDCASQGEGCQRACLPRHTVVARHRRHRWRNPPAPLSISYAAGVTAQRGAARCWLLIRIVWRRGHLSLRWW